MLGGRCVVSRRLPCLQLLKRSPRERLGGGSSGVEDIKLHPYMADIDWAQLQNEAYNSSRS